MKCSKCGAELTENMKFCSSCGEKIEAETHVPDESVTNEPVAEETVTQTASTPSTEKKSIADKVKDQCIAFWKKLSVYGKVTTVLLTVFTLLCLIAFLADKTFAGIIAITAIALVIVALLIKKEIIKTPKKWLHTVALILPVVLIIPYLSVFRANRPSSDIDLDTTIDTSFSDDENIESESTESNNTEDESQESTTTDYKIDYANAQSFEKALNDGVKVKGKIVQFDVVEYKPDSALGINCWSGEHLNFISKEELDVGKGSIIVGRITEETSKTLGSWKIPYEVLSIGGEKVESDTTQPSDTEEPSDTQPSEITMTMGEDDFKGMNYKEAEKIFREMGFTSFEYRTVDTETESAADTICYIEITEWFIGDSDFVKGDKFDIDSTVTFFSYKYEAPAAPSPVFYSTNDYETAKKGNTGVFSYKNKSGSYDIYWIINFDEGYVYWFTEGNGESTCDKVKIVSGDLNDKITVTWHDGGDQWSWYLHFKYVNHPETLVVNDHNGFATEFTTTDLDDALELRNTKRIKEY